MAIGRRMNTEVEILMDRTMQAYRSGHTSMNVPVDLMLYMMDNYRALERLVTPPFPEEPREDGSSDGIHPQLSKTSAANVNAMVNSTMKHLRDTNINHLYKRKL